MILTEYINYCNYTTGMSYASYISQVQVVCSMENCDVSPSTLTGCAGGPRATLGISGRGRPPWGTEDSMIIMVHQSIFWTHPIWSMDFSGQFYYGLLWNGFSYGFFWIFLFKWRKNGEKIHSTHLQTGETADLHGAWSRSVSWHGKHARWMAVLDGR